MSDVSFEEIKEKIKQIIFFENFDFIVAIANGGIIPAVILSDYKKIPLEIIYINYRNDENKPCYEKPHLLKEKVFNTKNKNILLVDDRIKTGATISFVKEILSDANTIKTFAVNGNADYFLYNTDCFKMPWKI